MYREFLRLSPELAFGNAWITFVFIKFTALIQSVALIVVDIHFVNHVPYFLVIRVRLAYGLVPFKCFLQFCSVGVKSKVTLVGV